MPVTATLLRKFAAAFGEDVTNELVNWFAQVEAAQRSELETSINRRFDLFEARLEQRLAETKAELRTEIAGLRVEIAGHGVHIANQRSDLLKWMFVFWAGTVIPLAGLMVALTKF